MPFKKPSEVIISQKAFWLMQGVQFDFLANVQNYFAIFAFILNIPPLVGVNVISTGMAEAPSQATIQRSCQAPDESGCWVTSMLVLAASGVWQLVGFA